MRFLPNSTQEIGSKPTQLTYMISGKNTPYALMEIPFKYNNSEVINTSGGTEPEANSFIGCYGACGGVIGHVRVL